MAVPPPPPSPPRTPPRFVPTLTEVVQVGGGAPAPQVPAAPARTTVMPAGGLPPFHSPAPVAATRAAAQPAGMAPPTVANKASLGGAAAMPRPAAPLPGPEQSRTQPVGRSIASPAGAAGAGISPDATPSAPARSLPDGMEEYVVHRIMQRVDVVLDQRLREAIATVVQEQTRSVLPRLREEIESVVRHAVYEAVADELASGAPPGPRR